MIKLTRMRMMEIGVAILLTVAALAFFGVELWAAENPLAALGPRFASNTPALLQPVGLSQQGQAGSTRPCAFSGGTGWMGPVARSHAL